MYCRKTVFERNFCDQLPVSEHHIVGHEYGGLSTRAFGIVERQLQVLYALEDAREDFYAARRSRCADTFQCIGMPRKRGIPKYGDFCRPRNSVKKQLKSLSSVDSL
jgi:hypothetical protein